MAPTPPLVVTLVAENGCLPLSHELLPEGFYGLFMAYFMVYSESIQEYMALYHVGDLR